MLNPDGVIVGNYRCSLAGRDLNRSYKSMLKESFPPVWHTKVMIKKYVSYSRDIRRSYSYDIRMYCSPALSGLFLGELQSCANRYYVQGADDDDS